MNRRDLLKGIAAAALPIPVAAAPKENPKGLPVLLFDEDGEITNFKELFAGVPWKTIDPAVYGDLCPAMKNDIRLGVPKRSRRVWLPRANALIEYDHFVWGEVKIEEQLRVEQDALKTIDIEPKPDDVLSPFCNLIPNPEPLDLEGTAYLTGRIKTVKASCRVRIAAQQVNWGYHHELQVKDVL